MWISFLNYHFLIYYIFNYYLRNNIKQNYYQVHCYQNVQRGLCRKKVPRLKIVRVDQQLIRGHNVHASEQNARFTNAFAPSLHVGDTPQVFPDPPTNVESIGLEVRGQHFLKNIEPLSTISEFWPYFNYLSDNKCNLCKRDRYFSHRCLNFIFREKRIFM